MCEADEYYQLEPAEKMEFSAWQQINEGKKSVAEKKAFYTSKKRSSERDECQSS